MLDGSATSKYLVYALGEILLVMIGILLALQVNNWNQFQQKKEKEIINLIELKKSLEFDLKYELEACQAFYDELHQKVDILIQVIETRERITNDSLAPIIGEALLDKWYFLLQTAAFENIKSIGIDIISNDTLRSRILNIYNGHYTWLGKMSDDFDNYYNTQIIPLINTYFEGEGVGPGNLRLHPREPALLYQNKAIKTNLWHLKEMRNRKRGRAHKAAKFVDEVISEIEAEIERLKN